MMDALLSWAPFKKDTHTLNTLNQWFDTSKHIEQSDLDLAIDQMRLYAFKLGLDPDHPECKRQYREMRKAVKEHNEQFPQPVPYQSRAAKLRKQKKEQK